VPKPIERAMPLFYRKPQPLRPVIHDDLRLKDGDYAFARETNAVPLAVIEFAQAMRHFPIVFAQADGFPVAVLGLERANRFVADDRWVEGAYVPAYVRRYPFVFVEASDDRFALALDMASERVAQGGEEGEPLFADGEPTPITEGAMAFCREFLAVHVQTRAFVEALQAQDLLIPRQADAELASGRPVQLAGFLVVDAGKFGDLADDVLLDWHRKGWLALVHFHLASLDRFTDLLALESRIEAAVPDMADAVRGTEAAEAAAPAPSTHPAPEFDAASGVAEPVTAKASSSKLQKA
jgi:hypothetical protein